jgi:hypothetical protein
LPGGVLEALVPNLARFVFLDPAAQAFYVDWETLARDVVALLRAEAGRVPYDKALTDRPSGREVPLRRPTNTRRRQHRALLRRGPGPPLADERERVAGPDRPRPSSRR